MFEFVHKAIVFLAGDTLGIAGDCFDVGFQVVSQQLVHFSVVVVIVPNAKHTLYVVPYS